MIKLFHQSSQTGFAVAIDGPVGVGKSTNARNVAAALNMTYIDTGAMYRAVALYIIRHRINPTNEPAITAALPNINVKLSHIDGQQRVYLNNEDITEKIRTQSISESTSVIASYAAVREKLVAEQKKLAATGQVVMDGRDIGSHVLPWAQVKIYLDADVDTRTARRALDLEAKGQQVDIAQIRQETIIRDERDKTRTHSPLIQTEDAIYIDSSNMTPEEVVSTIVKHVQKKQNESK